MRPLPREALVAAVSGAALRGLQGPPLTGVFTDTRRPPPVGAEQTSVFFALQGPRFDGHAFLATAVQAGAGALVVSDASAIPSEVPPGTLICAVDDTRAALMAFAAHVRQSWAARVIGVTGSVGKTTVKELTAAALAPFGKVGRTPGNLNNDIGLPLAICGMDGDEDFVVLELGMSAPGEIAALAAVAQPDVGVVTSAVAAHLAFFPSVDAIADAKAELFEGLGGEAWAVANADNALVLERARRLHGGRLVTYGRAAEADVRLLGDAHRDGGVCARIAPGVTAPDAPSELVVALPHLGRHNAHNAAAAVAVVRALGLPLAEAGAALERAPAAGPHRMAVVDGVRGLHILDDSYNANPTSVLAALEALADLSRGAPARAAVLGTMRELGEDAPALHAEVGRAAARAGLDALFCVGEGAQDLARGAREGGLHAVKTAADAQELDDAVRAFAGPKRWLLLKASRGERLERLLPTLTPSAAGDDAPARADAPEDEGGQG